MSFILALFDLIKGLAWPALAFFVVWQFRDGIGKALPMLAGRLTKFGPSGMELAAPSEQKEAPTENREKEAEVRPERTVGGPRPAAMTVLEVGLRASVNAISDPTKQVNALIEDLAEARLERGHERVYRRIFGSQIRGLASLALQKTTTAREARDFFETATATVREQYEKYGFDGWIGFLIQNDLVKRVDNDFAITPFGEDFVTYYIRNQLPEKPL